jgi:hypothetical protein
MRAILIVMSCLGAGSLASAVAQAASPETPAASATPTATAVPAATPAVAAAPAAAAVAPPASAAAPATATAATASAATAEQTAEQSAWEKQLLSRGYKPAMLNGQKVWCRKEEILGSRLAPKNVCAPAEQLELNAQTAKEATEHAQKMPVWSGR